MIIACHLLMACMQTYCIIIFVKAKITHTEVFHSGMSYLQNQILYKNLIMITQI